MAGQEVTFDEVAAAANSLQNDGKRVTIEAVSDLFGAAAAAPASVHRHLTAWRASSAKPTEVPIPDLPETLAAALGSWAQQFAVDSGAGSQDALEQSQNDVADLLEQVASLTEARDEALATLEERAESITRLTAELRDARNVATDALVGKAKDRLAIDGKDNQLADLRSQIERNVAASAAESDARLTAEMELVGAVTARDNFAAEIKELRSQLDACQAERRAARG
ncbi:DNA-binding protein [Rugamonas sp. CCM 8940]|uniref:DNA-binding protein n=1 Tax=Rugamonas sp. CCM 8940 TaxID=2765359 RepID=UPI0018F68E2D|nr:DNA-binding protein [Rugamonas sp. CCM 8940]MBJ7312796.1 DNA-binding protein [Rugamonas sp. CCM 8940]